MMYHRNEMRYEKIVTVDGDGKRTSRLLEITSENSKWLVGEEVDKEGDKKDRLCLIDQTTIVRRISYKMNLHYGELETAEEE